MSDSNSPPPERFPNLYALLGLEPLEQNLGRIQAALKRLAGRIQAQARSQTSDESNVDRSKIEHARRLFELGKQQLLDPQRKLRYDQQWQASYGQAVAQPAQPQSAELPSTAANPQRATQSGQQSSNPSIANKQPAFDVPSAQGWDLSELESLLPAGDPQQPFRASEFLAGRTSPLASRYDDDFAKLQSLLSPIAAEKSPDTTPLDSPTVATGSPELQSNTTTQHLVGTKQASAGTGRPTPSLAQRLRKKQERGLLWGAIGALSALAIVLGVAYWLMQPEQDSTLAVKSPEAPAATPTPAANTLLPLASSADQPDNKPPRRSGLPSVPGFSAPDATAGANPGTPTPPDNQPMDDPGKATAAPTLDTPMAPMTPIEAMPGVMPQTDAMPPVMPPTGVPPTPAAVELSDSQREQWSTAMLAARATIGQQNYAEATRQLDAAQALAKTPLQTEQLARLVKVEQLAQDFGEAVQRAIGGMGAGETFTIGSSTPVSFVESTGERLTLRMRGQNQSFAMTELPIGLAFGIADMAMDREHPRSLAAKAAFALVHPAAQGNDMAAQRALQMMSAAIAAGAVSEDMTKVFTDDYKLP